MPMGRGTKGPTRPPVGSGMDDYLNVRALFDIISSTSRGKRSFSYDLGTLRLPSVRPTVRL